MLYMLRLYTQQYRRLPPQHPFMEALTGEDEEDDDEVDEGGIKDLYR